MFKRCHIRKKQCYPGAVINNSDYSDLIISVNNYKKMLRGIFLLVVLTTFHGVDSCGDFYWRDYNGTVPRDAISAGFNNKGEKFYIGHAYLHHYGILMGTIIPGQTEITIPCYGVKKANSRIRILCAKQHSRYHWLRTQSEYYASSVRGKCPVVGGYDVLRAENSKLSLGTLHVGRTIKDGEIIIGNIAAYSLELRQRPVFYYPYRGNELNTHSYDVLMYTDAPLAIYNGVQNIHDLDLAVVKD